MNKTYIIAELSANHRQQYDEAIKLIIAAKKSGADAVKTQTYTPDTLTIDCDRPEFMIKGGTLWDKKKLYDLYAEAYMPWEWNSKLKKFTEELGMDYITTVYDKTSVDYLEPLNLIAYKIASFEMNDTLFLEYVASKHRHMFVSTGMATFSEISDAIKAIQKHKCPLTLLKCNSGYPASLSEMNLLTIPDMKEEFEVPVGLSDHTLGITAPVVAVALGAIVIEKHFTFDRNVKSPDSEFSLEPNEFTQMVRCVREAEQSLGEVKYMPTKGELKSLPFRRSLYAIKDIQKGETFTEDNIRSIRPRYGMSPSFMPWVIGKTASCDIEKGTPLGFSHITFKE